MRYIFASVFKDEFQEFLELRKAANKVYEPAQGVLGSLDRFLVSKEVSSKTLPESLMLEWLADMNAKPQTRHWRLQSISPMIKYLRSLGIVAYLPEKPRARSEYVPFIFSDIEFLKIIDAADNRQPGFNTATISASAQMPFLLRLLYSCGLRLGEALSLKWEHMDLESAVITVRHAKNEKQRVVPMSNSLNELCKQYRASGLMSGKNCDFLFSNRKGGHYSLGYMWNLFSEILETLGIGYARGMKGGRGPCLHCLRHLFVLRSFAKMESEGYPFRDSVPYLSTYLGHSSVMETDHYLRFSHEIYEDAHAMISNYTQGVFPEVIDE